MTLCSYGARLDDVCSRDIVMACIVMALGRMMFTLEMCYLETWQRNTRPSNVTSYAADGAGMLQTCVAPVLHACCVCACVELVFAKMF